MGEIKYGIGRSPKGKINHIVVAIKEPGAAKPDYHALCDKRQKGMFLAEELTGKCKFTVGCKKCQGYKIFKDTFKTKSKEKKVEEKPAPVADGAKEIGMTATPKEPKPVAKNSDEPGSTKDAEAIDVTESTNTDDAFVEVLGKDGTYKIFHQPTGNQFFEGIPEDYILECLEDLNQLTEVWGSKSEKCPKGYIAKCRAVIEKYCGPSSVEEKEEKPEKEKSKTVEKKKKATKKKKPKPKKKKRTLKRRGKSKPKKPRRTLRRRGKATKGKGRAKPKRTLKRRLKKNPVMHVFGESIEEPKGFVVYHLINGKDRGSIKNLLKFKFLMENDKAEDLLSKTSKWLFRVKACPMTVKFGVNPDRDFFQAMLPPKNNIITYK